MSLESPASILPNMYRFLLVRFGAGSAVPRYLIVLDLLECIVIGAIFGNFVYSMLKSSSNRADVCTLLLVISESLPFFFIILRTPSNTLSQRPSDWVIAICASISPLLVRPDTAASSGFENAALILMLIGFSLQVAAKIALGTRFGIIAANRGVCTIGPYRFVRHPMYAGYVITQIGFLVIYPSPFNASMYALALALQLIRMDREERVLRMDMRYAAYAGRVRYRLLPGIY